MEPITTSLVASVMAVLMPYVTKGAEEFARAAGEVAFDRARGLFKTIKDRLSGDQGAADNLARFEEKPEIYKPVVEDILQDKLAQDKSLADELEQLLKDMGPQLEIIQKMDVAEDVTGLEAGEMTRGSAAVTQEIKEAKNVKGAKIDRIG